MKLRGALLAVPAFFGVAALCGIVAHQNSDDRRGRLEVDGRERSYELHVPKNYDGNQPIPLVLALHGRFGTGAGEEKRAHLDKLSDKHAFGWCTRTDSGEVGLMVVRQRPPTSPALMT